MAVRARHDGTTTRRPPLLPLVGATAPICGAWLVLVIVGAGREPWVFGACCAAAVLAGTGAALSAARDARRTQGIRLREHHDRAAGAVRRRLEKMDPGRLGAHVAELCRRDGLADVTATRVRDDAYSVDVTGTLPGGTRVAVRCRSVTGAATVSGSIVTRFTAAEHHHGHALILATNAGGFSPRAHTLAADHGSLLLLDRRALAVWDLGTSIPAPLPAARPGRSTPSETAAGAGAA
ncbi:restriction endonuclease [Yinghuangia sp. ASG 101]|uniref:restriction endonuclease n=1 Tax=Yinghuangia sp. ASG 101 TaxID=2896848 RepID=UPI001E59F6B0|nr:restriction endonuclease [Yinghuangia sp. ASG 101]UGQ14052.1 restriction endonuclease [Yinghuangia sp. ASG 101]